MAISFLARCFSALTPKRTAQKSPAVVGGGASGMGCLRKSRLLTVVAVSQERQQGSPVMTTHCLSALIAKRAELAGEITASPP